MFTGSLELKTGKINADIETNNKIYDACTNYQTLSKNKLYSLLLIFQNWKKTQIRKHLFNLSNTQSLVIESIKMKRETMENMI